MTDRMGPKATLRAIQAADRRQQRGSQKRHRELIRQAKEQAKLTSIEQARLEVEVNESCYECLASHRSKHQGLRVEQAKTLDQEQARP